MSESDIQNAIVVDVRMALAEVNPELAEVVRLDCRSDRWVTREEYRLIYRATYLANINRGSQCACEECCWKAYTEETVNPDGTLQNPCTHA